MRFGSLLIAVLAGVAIQAHAAQDYSKEYQQCMKFTYGNKDKAEKCIAKELKLQKKVLKKSYKNYLKINANNAAIIKNQHKMFESKVQQQCGRIRAGNYTKIQQGQCQLSMVLEQTNYYQSRSFVAKK